MSLSRIFYPLVGLVAIAVIVGLALRPATVIGAGEKPLAYSLRGDVGADKTGVCSGSDDEFACRVFGSSGRRARFKVSVDNYGCYDATRMGGGKKGLPKTLSGCITIVDLVGIGN